MGTLCLESRVVVNRAIIWVMVVAKNMCHVVKKRAVLRSTGKLRRPDWVASAVEAMRSYGNLLRKMALANGFHVHHVASRPREETRGDKTEGVLRIGLGPTELGTC